VKICNAFFVIKVNFVFTDSLPQYRLAISS